MYYYAIKYFNEFSTGGRELGSHFVTKVLEGYPVTRKIPKVFSPIQIEKGFSIPGWYENESYKFETYDDTLSFPYGFP